MRGQAVSGSWHPHATRSWHVPDPRLRLCVGSSDLGPQRPKSKKLILNLFWSQPAFKPVKIDYKLCKTEFFECSFGSPRDGAEILYLSRFHAQFLVRLDNLDVEIPRVSIIFLKIGMGAHKYPPKLAYGGSSCKIQN